jgi:CheY-like chemotaxis protein
MNAIAPTFRFDDLAISATMPPILRMLEGEPEVPDLATVLLVDDDIIDVMAIRRAFKTLRINNTLVTAGDGIEALDRLRGTNGLTKVPRPHIVLLDLNMPRMGGVEFLEELREDPDLCRTVVFVMTTSGASEDRVRAYQMNIAGYLLKQYSGRSFVDAIGMLRHYWSVVQLPD